MSGGAKRLIVTADDVGIDRGMTEGAIRGHQHGIVTACSVVPGGRSFDDAVSRLRELPGLEVGVHLTLVEEASLTGLRFPKSYVSFLLGRKNFLAIERELRAQLERVLATGLRVTHLNSHQHLHMLPSLFAITTRLASEYGIGYVRRVNDRGGRAGVVRRTSIAALNSFGSGGSTIGVTEAGHLTKERIVALLAHVEGVTELVTHPGIGVGGYEHWRYDWDVETQALCDPDVRAALAEQGIELVTPSAITKERTITNVSTERR